MFRKFKAKRFIKIMNKLAGQLSITLESISTDKHTLFLEIFHMYKSPVMYTINFKTKEIKSQYTQIHRDWSYTGAVMIQNTKKNLALYFFNKEINK